MSADAKPAQELVHVSSHPVLTHKITILRSSATQPHTFRAALREVTYHLGYEATARLTTRPVAISVPVPNKAGGDEKIAHMDYTGHKLKEQVALLPIMRSGLGMTDSMLELLPNAAVHHIGMYKIIGQTPVQYYNRLPRKCNVDVAYILDPVISTSQTVMTLIAILKKWGAPEIHVISVIGSSKGVQQITEAHPDVYMTLGMVDDQTNPDGLVLPGLGDSGDRLFGTGDMESDENKMEQDESLLHYSKRTKRDVNTVTITSL